MSSDKRCCPTDAPPAACHYTPQGDSMYMVGPLDAKAGILLLGDIFGMHGNTKRTADDLAKEGYLVVMPDFFEDKAWAEADFPPPSYEDPKWLEFHKLIQDMDYHHPKAMRAIALLRKLGVQKVAALGLCWGAKLVMRLSSEKAIDAAAMAHPSLQPAEVDQPVRTPFCVLTAVDDHCIAELKSVVDNLSVKPKVYKHYMHLHHGFLGARFDFENPPPEQAAERADAFRTLVTFCKDLMH